MSEIQNAKSLANLTFNLLARCQEKEARLADAHKLLEAEFKCFRLMGSGESLNNNELAKRMKLSPGRITRIMDGLVEKGYMQRKIDKGDRRNMILSLSKKGKNLNNKLSRAYIQIHKEILQEINVSQHRSLLTAMEQLHSAVEKWLQKPR
jgi:DNA-binding MarR family transcriptional regulator